MRSRSRAGRCGRLIRTETDRATVTVLDRRLATSEYGKRLLRGLPPFRLQISGPPRNRETDG
jgi:Rad3-related DNA helicase